MQDQALFQLSYVSTAKDGLKFEDIKSILEQSNGKNKDLEITGILVYCNKHFFQILEGEKKYIEDVFNTISVDCRHDNIIKIQECPITQRHFKSWAMAFKSYNKELKELDNFNNEQFYTYIHTQLEKNKADISMKILADFFDLNG
jgi:hypothetical protein